MKSWSALLCALGITAVGSQPQPAVITSCGGYIKWANLTVTPNPPVAGETAAVNGTGVINAPVSGGVGEIDAYIWGVDMFTAPINTCGLGQQIDIDGMATAVFDALPCPVAANQLVNMGFVVPIPSAGSGAGAINITLIANDTSTNSGGRLAFCLDLQVTL